MYMKVKTVADAWELAKRIFPGAWERLRDVAASEKAGYPIYRSTDPASNAYICDLDACLDLMNYDDGHTDSIWIEDRMPQKPEAADVTVGMYKDRTVLGEVKVREVVEVPYYMALGLIAKVLDDGRPGIELTMSDGEKASFGAENVAYVRFN